MTPRSVHPVAWWLWAAGLAVAAIRLGNPLLLGLVVVVAGWVVAARRTDAPWGRSFSLALRLGAFIIVLRTVLATVFGLRVPGTTLFTLPSAQMPDWAAGVNVGGPVTVELLAAAATEGLRLAAIVACFGAANALANPYRLLRSLPAVLYELGVALTVALAVVPNTVLTAQRIREARRLRGRRVRGLRSLRGLVMPVLEGALERSVDLAASMDARGYGRRRAPGAVAAVVAPVAVVVGLIGVAVGAYAVLDVGSPGALGLPVLTLGSLLLAVGMVVSGRRVERSRYRPDRWLAAEWLVVALGVAAPVGVAVAAAMDPASVGWTLSPLSWPAVPAVAVMGIAASLVAGILTPPPVMTLTGLHLATAADPLGSGPAAGGTGPGPGAATGPGTGVGPRPGAGVGEGTRAGVGTGATARVPELAATTGDGGSA